jgi:hypothetical protein
MISVVRAMTSFVRVRDAGFMKSVVKVMTSFVNDCLCTGKNGKAN